MEFGDLNALKAFGDARELSMREGSSQLQNAGALQGLLEKARARQQAEQMRVAMEQSGGDLEKVLEIALKSGNVEAAAKLTPLVKMQQEKALREQTVQGMREISGAPASQQELGAGQPPAIAGEAPAAPKETPQARIEKLNKMSLLYANNPVVAQRIQAEIDRLSKVENKTRTYQKGDASITEELQPDGTWKELGRGPKFARQVEPVGGEGAVGITDDTLAMDAWRYLTDGTLPPNMGRGAQGSGQAAKIRNESSRLAKEMGMAPDEIRFAQLTNKAQVAAIAQLGRARAQILQSEKLANYNADLALKASQETDRSGVPLLNRGIQWAQENLAGDERLRKFTIANETFISEYAKVMSGGYGAAAPTEGAQSRAHTLLNRAATKEEYVAGVNQLKREMKNREKSLNDQMDEERGRLRGGIGKKEPVTPPTLTPPVPTAPAAGGAWTPDKEQRYQELLKKRGS